MSLVLYDHGIIFTVNFHDMSNRIEHHGPSGAVYGLGVIGAAIFYISQATSFWSGFVGFLKALAWPAFLVYQALVHLQG